MAASSIAAAGLAFAIALADGGKSVPIDRFTLKVPGAKGALVLSLEGVDLIGGSFVTPVRLANETDFDVLSPRIDLVSVTETRREGGREVTHPIDASAGAAPAWDVLRSKADVAGQLFRVSPVAFSPETSLIVVLGAVSGVAAVGSFEVEGARNPARLDVDTASLFVTDASGRIVRCALDGRGAAEVKQQPAQKPDSPGGPCARARLQAVACRAAPGGGAWAIEGRELTQLDAEGRRVRSIRPGGEGLPVALAFGPDGRLFVATAGEDGRSGSVRVFRPF
ncbi:MAG TPA: hypothetical protein VLJ18_03985 [Thermoanaerobaculia bacterium]|nr:hypothetical protein [Thermoanaerobaculia bacterium]